MLSNRPIRVISSFDSPVRVVRSGSDAGELFETFGIFEFVCIAWNVNYSNFHGLLAQ